MVTFVAFLSSMMWLSWEWQLCFAFVLNKLAVIHHLRFIWSKNYLVVSYDSGNLFPYRKHKYENLFSMRARVWYECVLYSTISMLKPLFKQSIRHKSMWFFLLVSFLCCCVFPSDFSSISSAFNNYICFCYSFN